MKTVRSTCPYCGVGCGVIARTTHDGKITIEGDHDHPANFGKLCSKGLALAETMVSTGRLTTPLIEGRTASWDEATAFVAERFSSAIKTHGPDSVALYVSGQLLTEDYYVANKFMKGYVGSANIDTNSRLCMASAVAAHKRAFGADIVPCNYTDLDEADLVVLVGSNTAWCHPVLFQRLLAAKEKRGTKIIVIDPRRTPTAESADLFLPLKPQSDVALFNGLLRYLYLGGHTDSQFLFAHTSGLSEALMTAREWTIEAVSAATALPATEVEAFYRLFAKNDRTVTAFSMGVNQSASGTDKANAIINVHLVTGRIGKPGAGPFSLTGQPNAMGGREVGGLANMLAAHMDIDNPAHRHAVQSFWSSPTIATRPGLKAVDLFKAVHDGRIKALWIMGTNPAVSMPDASFVAEALRRCEFVAVSDAMRETETTQYADVLLPAQGWGEKDGTVTNTERRISRQRRFTTPIGEARPDWRIISDVAQAMGFHGFEYQSAAQIFAEHVALTQQGNDGRRKLDLTPWSRADYDSLEPAQWGGERPFSDGQFQTADGRARFVPTIHDSTTMAGMILNTGRMRDQWHTMTRTGLVPRLFSHRAEPYVEVNPADAASASLRDGDIVEVQGPGEAVHARALITQAVRPGSVFQPMHWSGPFARHALANAATQQIVDPVSGQPALKSATVSIRKFDAAWYGFGISINAPICDADYFATRPIANGHAFECAGRIILEDWHDVIDANNAGAFEVSSVQGTDKSSFRSVAIQDDKLVFALFIAPQPVAASREWLLALLEQKVTPLAVLAGRPAKGLPDDGPILCACMQVGRNRISRFIAESEDATEAQICKATGAGTGCGSCRPEVRIMLTIARAQQSISNNRPNILSHPEHIR
jgi:assimilatory nitrate reductase catalytic subunit